MSDINPIIPILKINALIEAILFVAPNAVTPAQIATAIGVSIHDVERGLSELQADYTTHEIPRGIQIQRLHGRVQLTSNPEAAEVIEAFLGFNETSKLSQAALETLAVIAYRDPITRPQIDAIRGVNSDGVLRTLLSKGLIQEIGRAEAPGRPILYSVTTEFLQYFGLDSLEKLPPIEEQEELNGGNIPSDLANQ